MDSQIFKRKEYQLSYRFKKNSSKKTVLLITSGVAKGSEYPVLHKILSKQFTVYSVDLPGEGESRAAKKRISLKGLAEILGEFCDAKKIKNPVLIVDSQAGNIAIEYLRQGGRCDSLIMIGSGEYFGYVLRTLLSLLFLPTLWSKWYRKFSAWLYSRFRVCDFSSYQDSQLQQLSRRWFKALWWRLPKRFETDVRSLLIGSSRDKVILGRSMRKFQRMLHNLEMVDLECGHRHYAQELARRKHQEIVHFLQ